ncbi:MAG: hypothetical protein CVT72_04090 [Alphaproteobacteria bacterium HGW-Alphaproteobacteria-11]|nr:MAG: hypothetical protein CVT72_04090 [Alphaproteobacteria bacterium HGW-Alphaproteobacteria-11]
MNLFSASLTARLTRRMLAILIAGFALLLVILTVQYETERDLLRDRSLRAQAGDLAAHIVPQADGVPAVVLPETLAAPYARADRAFVWLLLDAEGRVVASSHGQAEPLAPLPAAGGDPYFRRPDLDGYGDHIGATVTLEGFSPPFFLQVAQGEAHRDVLQDSIIEEFLERSWMWLLFVFAAATGVTLWTVRQSLSSLTRVSTQARAIGPGSLDRRLPKAGLPEEVRPLVDAVNGALDRIESGYAREREFTANAAHELRTPLAVLRVHVETLTDMDEVPEIIEELGGIERLVSQLLWLARADALELHSDEAADLCAVARGVTEQLAPPAARMGKSLALTGAEESSPPVRGNADFLALALRNLVENALAHTPRGGTVEVRFAGPGRIDVIDDGPGVRSGDEARIFERFVRARPQAYEGAGLGLSIAARIAEVHGGRIGVAREPGGGASFSLILPLRDN